MRCDRDHTVADEVERALQQAASAAALPAFPPVSATPVPEPVLRSATDQLRPPPVARHAGARCDLHRPHAPLPDPAHRRLIDSQRPTNVAATPRALALDRRSARRLPASRRHRLIRAEPDERGTTLNQRAQNTECERADRPRHRDNQHRPVPRGLELRGRRTPGRGNPYASPTLPCGRMASDHSTLTVEVVGESSRLRLLLLVRTITPDAFPPSTTSDRVHRALGVPHDSARVV